MLLRYNLQAGEVNKAVNTALAGQAVGQLVERNRRFDIVVRLPAELRADDAEIQKLPLGVGDGCAGCRSASRPRSGSSR
jgi:cobalt-zinc-cadmium resistance protein CzcA